MERYIQLRDTQLQSDIQVITEKWNTLNQGDGVGKNLDGSGYGILNDVPVNAMQYVLDKLGSLRSWTRPIEAKKPVILKTRYQIFSFLDMLRDKRQQVPPQTKSLHRLSPSEDFDPCTWTLGPLRIKRKTILHSRDLKCQEGDVLESSRSCLGLNTERRTCLSVSRFRHGPLVTSQSDFHHFCDLAKRHLSGSKDKKEVLREMKS